MSLLIVIDNLQFFRSLSCPIFGIDNCLSHFLDLHDWTGFSVDERAQVWTEICAGLWRVDQKWTTIISVDHFIAMSQMLVLLNHLLISQFIAILSSFSRVMELSRPIRVDRILSLHQLLGKIAVFIMIPHEWRMRAFLHDDLLLLLLTKALLWFIFKLVKVVACYLRMLLYTVSLLSRTRVVIICAICFFRNYNRFNQVVPDICVIFTTAMTCTRQVLQP